MSGEKQEIYFATLYCAICLQQKKCTEAATPKEGGRNREYKVQEAGSSGRPASPSGTVYSDVQ